MRTRVVIELTPQQADRLGTMAVGRLLAEETDRVERALWTKLHDALRVVSDPLPANARRLLEKAATAISDDLYFAGPDEVRQHPSLQHRDRLVTKIRRYLDAEAKDKRKR